MGLWLLQECQRGFAQSGHATDYDTLLADVDAVSAFAALIDPDDARFLAPLDMPAAINTYLLEHGQVPLSAPVAFARCIMESLVLRYCEVFHQIGQLTGTAITVVHVLGAVHAMTGSTSGWPMHLGFGSRKACVGPTGSHLRIRELSYQIHPSLA